MKRSGDKRQRYNATIGGDDMIQGEDMRVNVKRGLVIASIMYVEVDMGPITVMYLN